RVGDEAQDRGQEHYTAHTHRPLEEVRDGQEAGTRQGGREQGQACGSQAHHSAQADSRNPGYRTDRCEPGPSRNPTG
ncbi:MAG TPA: hypothetical protein VEO53_05225, partial [Candidatus Binatia bacterium]|nr:hypothetical protein [Candidatus Binatia bacterium]